MSIYRGAGGASDATNDATVNAVAGYASAAASSATNAATSAANAATSAGAANTSVTSATTQASNAATSASNAASSASSAAGSVTSAATQASNAATSASNASTSASNASTSASSAFTSATTASSAASASSASAGTATTKATEAAASAASALAIYGNTTAMNAAVTASQTAASNAATSASSAATSAASALVYKDDAAGFASDANASYIAAAASAAYAATTVAGFDGNVASAITSAANASASASAAATSANNASTSATQAAASAAGATAIVTGVASTRPSIRPSLLLDFANTRVLDPRITFTRASTATFYDNDTSAVAEQNLLTYSQEFDNAAWVKASATVTANTSTAPDGTTTADTFTSSAVTACPKATQLTALTLGTHFYSVYLKAGTHQYVQLSGNYGSGYFANFDITAGAGSVGTKGAQAVTSSITSIGNNWFRCTVEFSNSDDVVIAIVSSASATYQQASTYVGTETISIWGAQLEQRSAVTAYTPTTTAAITNYIPVLQTAASGAARFDCNPVTRESLGLFIEESRTNLLTYSEQFDNAAWTKTGGTVSVNAFIAPDGTQTADNFVEDTSTGVHNISRTPPTLSGVNTFSFYIKPQGRTSLNITSDNQTIIPINSNVDLATGTVLTGNTKIDNVGNGVFRVACTTGVCTGATVIRIRLMSLDFSTSSYTGNGFSGIMVWGTQLEVGAFATSYIPTVASQVTRAADAASMTGTNFSSWYNVAQGTVYADTLTSIPTSSPNGNYYLCLSDGTTSNMISLSFSSGINGVVRKNGVSSFSQTLGSVPNNQMKSVMGYSSSSTYLSVNGVLSTQGTTSAIPTVTLMVIGNRGDSSSTSLANGTIKRIAYYPKALTSTELQGLTS